MYFATCISILLIMNYCDDEQLLHAVHEHLPYKTGLDVMHVRTYVQVTQRG